MVIRSLLPISLETMHESKEPVLLIALKIMRHAKLSFGDHVPYLRVLAPRKDCWVFRQASSYLVILYLLVFSLCNINRPSQQVIGPAR